MSTHPPPGKDKDKEEDDEDDMTLFINSAKFDISRVTEVGSLGVGKRGYDNDYQYKTCEIQYTLREQLIV